jgi:hypothetical protein
VGCILDREKGTVSVGSVSVGSGAGLLIVAIWRLHAAFKGGTHDEINFRLGQNDALHGQAHSNYLTLNEGNTTKLISPFQGHPGLRAPIWKCYHYFEENMTGLAATSVVL